MLLECSRGRQAATALAHTALCQYNASALAACAPQDDIRCWLQVRVHCAVLSAGNQRLAAQERHRMLLQLLRLGNEPWTPQ